MRLTQPEPTYAMKQEGQVRRAVPLVLAAVAALQVGAILAVAGTVARGAGPLPTSAAGLPPSGATARGDSRGFAAARRVRRCRDAGQRGADPDLGGVPRAIARAGRNGRARPLRALELGSERRRRIRGRGIRRGRPGSPEGHGSRRRRWPILHRWDEDCPHRQRDRRTGTHEPARRSPALGARPAGRRWTGRHRRFQLGRRGGSRLRGGAARAGCRRRLLRRRTRERVRLRTDCRPGARPVRGRPSDSGDGSPDYRGDGGCRHALRVRSSTRARPCS